MTQGEVSERKLALHYVATLEEARALVEAREDYWVCNCGCRERRGGCARSRTDVCLEFSPVTEASGSGCRSVQRSEVESILREADEKRLVARPFRQVRDGIVLELVEGICFCCDDCCGYFVKPGEVCDPGATIERTDLSLCNDCLACVAVCHFGARGIEKGRLTLHTDRCYGCGLCVDVCPSGGITMVRRT